MPTRSRCALHAACCAVLCCVGCVAVQLDEGAVSCAEGGTEQVRAGWMGAIVVVSVPLLHSACRGGRIPACSATTHLHSSQPMHPPKQRFTKQGALLRCAVLRSTSPASTPPLTRCALLRCAAQRFACIYTSHVSNLMYYSPLKSWKGRLDIMAHEEEGQAFAFAEDDGTSSEQ